MPRPPGPHRDDTPAPADPALSDSDLLHAVFEVAGSLLLVLDADGRILRFNRAVETLAGWALEEVRGQAVWDVLVAPEEREMSRASARAVARGETFPYRERTFITRDGRRRLVELRHTTILDAEGNVRLVVATGIDITERRAADARLKASEAWWRTILDQASEGVIVADASLQCLEVNARACELTGYSRAELLAMRIDDLHPPEHLAAQPLRLGGLDRGERVVTERTLRRQDGSTFEAELSSRRLSDGRYVAVVRDLTERHRTEEAMRAKDLALETASQAGQLGTWSWEAGEDAVTWSEGLRRIYGVPDLYQPSRAAYLNLVHPDDRALVHEVTERALRDGQPFDYEVRILRPDGNLRILRTRGEVTLGAGGDVVRMAGTGQDVTDRKYLEVRLRMAEKLEAVGRLAGGVAHDFNNLLTAVMGYAEHLVGGTRPDDPLHHSALQVRRAAEQAAGITRQLLAFARKQMLAPRDVDLNLVLTGLHDMLQRVIGEHVELVTVAAARHGRVHADVGQIEHVVLMLVLNARDAMPEGGRVTVTVEDVELDEESARRHAPATPGAYVALTVKDTGTGMDPETRARLFEPFFTTKPLGQGQGLGLASVYGIVKQSGGTIWVDSEVGRGSTFRVYLPRVAGEAREPAAASARQREPASTIMLVEDEPAVRGLVRDVLVRAGFQVIAAADGDEAMAAAATHDGAIDLVITDVVMPGMSGRELADQLVHARPDLQVLFVSGYHEDAIGHHGVTSQSFLGKPFTPAELEHRVRAILSARTAPAA